MASMKKVFDADFVMIWLKRFRKVHSKYCSILQGLRQPTSHMCLPFKYRSKSYLFDSLSSRIFLLMCFSPYLWEACLRLSKNRRSIGNFVHIYHYWICMLQEFELLYYNLSSARIFFRMENDDGEDEDCETEADSQSIASITSSNAGVDRKKL